MLPVIPFALLQNPQEPIPLADGSKVFCPICVANGYASGIESPKKWFFTANSVGAALWNVSIPRVHLGATFHGSSRGVRALFAYQAVLERDELPGLNLSYGLQSQETGATGAAVTLEKNYRFGENRVNLFGGVSRQTNETKLRTVFGTKYSPDGKWFIGNQFDGRAQNPFVQYVKGDYSVGLLLVSAKDLTLTFGVTF